MGPGSFQCHAVIGQGAMAKNWNTVGVQLPGMATSPGSLGASEAASLLLTVALTSKKSRIKITAIIFL